MSYHCNLEKNTSQANIDYYRDSKEVPSEMMLENVSINSLILCGLEGSAITDEVE
jgi:hypothetical protein